MLKLVIKNNNECIFLLYLRKLGESIENETT